MTGDGAHMTEITREMLLDLIHVLIDEGPMHGISAFSEQARELEDLLENSRSSSPQLLGQKMNDLCDVCRQAIKNELKPVGKQGASLPLVLVVDDDPIILLAYQTLLEGEVHLLMAKNATEALDIMREHLPSLVMLDDIMPGGITGLSFLEKIKTDQTLSGISVIMVTASNKKEHLLRGFAAGAVDYITKPFSPENFTRVIKNALKPEKNKVLLRLSDSTLQKELAERLKQLNCVIIEPDNRDIWDIIGSNRVIVIFDKTSLSLDSVIRHLDDCTNAHFFYLQGAMEKETVPVKDHITTIDKHMAGDEIVKRIGLLLSSQRQARTSYAGRFSSEEIT